MYGQDRTDEREEQHLGADVLPLAVPVRSGAVRSTTVVRAALPVVLEPDGDSPARPAPGRARAAAAPAPPEKGEDADDGGRLPVAGMAGLLGSGAFAVWTSLTCFVC